MKNQMLTAIMLITLSACGPRKAELATIPFNQPQPEGVKNLKEVPASFRGQFIANDSSVLTVEKMYVISKSVNEFKISKQEADTSKDIRIDKNYLSIRGIDEKYLYTLRNDTFCMKQIQLDTLYDLNVDFVRRFRGMLVFNQKRDTLWDVAILSIQNKELKIKRFGPDNLFEQLTKISNGHVVTDPTKKITVLRYLKPTKLQFEKLFQYNDSLQVDTYQKIRKE